MVVWEIWVWNQFLKVEIILEPVSVSPAVASSSSSVLSAPVVSSAAKPEIHDSELHNVSNSSEEPVEQNVSNQTVIQANSPNLESVIAPTNDNNDDDDQEIPSKDVLQDSVVSVNKNLSISFNIQ